MDNQVRILRKNPFAWWDKNVMRYLRSKYGRDKKSFLLIRSVYLALCEIESDFNDKPINFFTKTLGSYAGLARESAGKYFNLLVKEGLVTKTRVKDERTKKFVTGSIIEILGLENADNKASEPLSAYPSNGSTQQRDTPTTVKNINTDKKINNNVNVNENFKIFDNKKKTSAVPLSALLMHYGLKREGGFTKSEQIHERDYLAQELANKLTDPKSLGCYRKIADKIPQEVIFEVLASVRDTAQSGKIRQSQGALFVKIIEQYAQDRGIDLEFHQRKMNQK